LKNYLLVLKIEKIIEYINTKPGLCLEGIIETCNKILDRMDYGAGAGIGPGTIGGKKRHRKSKRKSNKINKRRKTRRKLK
jgi:hypothetical protein